MQFDNGWEHLPTSVLDMVLTQWTVLQEGDSCKDFCALPLTTRTAKDLHHLFRLTSAHHESVVAAANAARATTAEEMGEAADFATNLVEASLSNTMELDHTADQTVLGVEPLLADGVLPAASAEARGIAAVAPLALTADAVATTSSTKRRNDKGMNPHGTATKGKATRKKLHQQKPLAVAAQVVQ